MNSSNATFVEEIGVGGQITPTYSLGQLHLIEIIELHSKSIYGKFWPV